MYNQYEANPAIIYIYIYIMFYYRVNYYGSWMFLLWIALFGTVAWVTENCEWFHCGLHCLSLLFAKSTVNWSGAMTKLSLPYRVAKITRGWGYLFGYGENGQFGFRWG